MLKTIALLSLLVLRSTGVAGTISMVGPISSPNVGDAFVIDIDVTGITDLYAFQFDVVFDPTLLSTITVTEGGFLLSGGPTFFISGTIDNVDGTVTSTADTLIGNIPGVTGDGTLAEFQFTAQGAGTSVLSFANEILLNSSLGDITADTTFQNGALTVSGGASAPEPISLVLCCAALLSLVVFYRSPRRSLSSRGGRHGRYAIT